MVEYLTYVAKPHESNEKSVGEDDFPSPLLFSLVLALLIPPLLVPPAPIPAQLAGGEGDSDGAMAGEEVGKI